MNQDQESFFGMSLKVKSFDTKHSLDMAVVPAVATLYTEHNSLVTQLIQADTGSRADLRGHAIAKGIKREVLEKSSTKVSNAVAAYAAVNNDPVLKKRADVPASKWYSCSEEELITEASIMKNLATPLGAVLSPFGASAADITEIDTALTEFIDIVADPNLAIDQRKLDNTLVVKYIDDIRTNLTEKLDVVMRSFEVNNPNLYALYKSARAIDINGSVNPPTVEDSVAPATSKSLYKMPSGYDPQVFFTVQNLGSETVCFSLSTVENTDGINQVLLNPGETRSRLAENLAPDGVFLVVTNASASPVKVKLWVE